MTSRIGSARKVLPVLFVALALGCGGGGGGGDGGPFEVVAVNVADGDGLPVNQEVRVRFTSAIDAATVQDATVRVREGPDFTRQVPGDVVVNGDTLTFFPKLPALADASDGGFHPGGTYRLELPGFPIALTLASRSGRPLRSTYDTTFRVSSAMPPFFKDPSFGPPRVVGTNPASSVPPPSTPIRAGTFNVPTTLRLLFSEPLRPSSVTSRSIALVARDLAGDDAVPVDLVLEQTNLSVSVAIHPRSPLPENAILEVRAFGDITDLVGNPIRPFASQWRTGDEAPQSSCIEESFDTDANADAVLTNAHWGDVEPGVLSSGYGPGGSGVEGGFDPTSDAVVDADRLPSGDLAVLEFHDVHVPVGVTVHIVGSRPLVLRSATDAVIEGSLILDGGDGSTVTADSDEAGAPGGVGNAGGGAGGSGGCPASATTAISGVAGTGRGAGAGGIDQGRTGGAPGGGGGGGYLTLGDSGDGGGGGLGGTTYGGSSLDPTTGLLLAGSGGGGGACDDDFGTGPNDGGGGAGGGGGAILVVAAGDVIVRGAILARGGRGGDAGQGAGGGGGSGGAILVRGRSVDLRGGTLDVSGGAGGRSRLGISGNGGAGSPGRVRIENPNALPLLDGDTRILPSFDTSRDLGRFVTAGAFAPVAVSRFFDTFVSNPRFAFDTTDPRTGELTSAGTDLVLARSLAPGVRVRIAFEGAHEDPASPGMPDLGTRTGFRTDPTDVWGRRFVRFRVEFLLGDPPPLVDELPAIDSMRIRFAFF